MIEHRRIQRPFIVVIGCLVLLCVGCATSSGPNIKVWQCDETFWTCSHADADELTTLCEAGSGRACEKLGEALFDPSSGGDLDHGRWAMERSCELGRPRACKKLAKSYYADSERGDDLDRAAALYEQACDSGIAEGCLEGARIREGDAETTRAGAYLLYSRGCILGSTAACEGADALRAEHAGDLQSTFAASCEDGDERGCAVLGKFYALGIAVDEDREKARQLYELACNAEIPSGCFYLGVVKRAQDLPQTADGGPPKLEDSPDELVLSDAFFDGAELMCHGGSSYQCQQVAQFYQHGILRPRDPKRAFHLYVQGCVGGYEQACAPLMNAIQQRDPMVSTDPVGTLETLRTHCHDGHVDFCAYYGYAHLYGVGGASDLRRAYNAFRTACNDGNGQACTSVGVMHAVGQGVQQDFELAHSFYSRACDGDEVMGCSNLATLYIFGQGVEQDFARAEELLERACDRGEAAGCNRLKMLDEAWR